MAVKAPTRGVTTFEAAADDGRPPRFARIDVGAGREAADPSRIAVCRGSPVFTDPDIAALARERGDAAAWLELFARAGPQAPLRAQNRFAVAVIDGRTRRAYLAVDRFGIETWCYGVTGGELAFADRADALPGVARAIHPQAVFNYFYFHAIPAPDTIFAGVHRLPAAHILTFDEGKCSVERYWSPQFDESSRARVADLRDEFRAILRRAVARAAGAGTVGAFLSGGTDSSTVTGVLTDLEGGPAKTYSIGFDATGYDEMEYARIAARHFGAEHHEYYVTPRDLVDGIPGIARHFDQPFGNSSVLPAYCCARLARADGVATLLAGDGGDELFGGNSRYAKQRVFDVYRHLGPRLRSSLVEPIASRGSWYGELPVARKLVSYVEQARVDMPDRMEMQNMLVQLGTASIFESDFLAQVAQDDPSELQRAVYRASGARSLINRMLEYDWRFTLADNDLPKVLGAADTAGVDVAFPLLDHEVLAFSLALAPSLKLKGLRLRHFFKEALRGFLPDATLAKKKHGFGLPFGPWALADGALRAFTLDSLDGLRRRRIVRADFLARLVDTLMPAYPRYYGEMLWLLMMLEQWLSAHETARGTPETVATAGSSGR